MRLDLILSMRDIYTPIPTWTKSQTFVPIAEAPSLKLSPNEHLSNDHENHPNQHETSNNLHDENVHSLLSLKKNQWKLKKQHD